MSEGFFKVWIGLCVVFAIASIIFTVWFLLTLLHAVQGIGQ